MVRLRGLLDFARRLRPGGGAGSAATAPPPHAAEHAFALYRARDFKALFDLAGAADAASRAAQLLLAVAYLVPERVVALAPGLLDDPALPPAIRRLLLEKLAIAQAKLGDYPASRATQALWRAQPKVSARSAALLAANLAWVEDPAAALAALREAEGLRGGLGPSFHLLATTLILQLEGSAAALARWQEHPAATADAAFLPYNLAVAANGFSAAQSALADAFAGFGLSSPAFRPVAGPVTVAATAATAQPAPVPEKGEPLVTVVMTAFNAQGTVAEALASLQAQSHRTIEIIVVEDRGDDATAELVAAVAAQDRRVRLLRNDRNVGTYLSRNRALTQARGAFVTFQDADDWSHPERIERHLAAMADPAVQLSRSAWIRMGADGAAVLRRWSRSFAHTNPSSLFIRTAALGRIGFFDAVRADADYEWARRAELLLGPGQIATIAAPLAIGFVGTASLTGGGATALDREYHSPVRAAYKQGWMASYPARLAAGTLARPALPPTLPYPVPPALAVDLAGVESWFGARD